MGKKKKVVKKGKKAHKNQPTSKKFSKYTLDGDKLKHAQFCPRCGPGVFLMDAKDRLYCGKCHYSEFKSRTPKPAEAAPKAA